ncbi:MAG: 5-formyltetrahydrofolate cyclo-ligase [Actinomycetota bacterium]|nr:5-formyltetrahydrofolate cyclo-ligase [Actinomycetota bacterium]
MTIAKTGHDRRPGEEDGGSVEVWKEAGGLWRWLYRGDGVELKSNQGYTSKKRAKVAARTAYPGLPIEERTGQEGSGDRSRPSTVSGRTGEQPPGDLQAEKQAIRTRIRGLRDSIPEAERPAMTKRIEERLFSLPEIRSAKTVLLFYSFGSEVSTRAIIERLLEEGRKVFLPYMEGSEMLAAELRRGDLPVTTSYGPKEPPDRTPVDPKDVDVVIAPGLAFDRSGHRIGYGGGNFDRYLDRLAAQATRVGIAYHLQLLPEVPHGPGDQAVDYVVTDKETITR